MKSMFFYAIVCSYLGLLGAASDYKKLSADESGSDKTVDMSDFITVTQGPSKLPFKIAYRPVGGALFACIVADPELATDFHADIAQLLLERVPYNALESHDQVEILQSLFEDVYVKHIVTDALKQNKSKSLLTSLFKMSLGSGGIYYWVFNSKYIYCTRTTNRLSFKVGCDRWEAAESTKVEDELLRRGEPLVQKKVSDADFTAIFNINVIQKYLRGLYYRDSRDAASASQESVCSACSIV